MSSQTSNSSRQNFSQECEAAINRQINLELNTSYFYLSLAYHFDRSDVANEGFYDFFKKMADKKHSRSHTFLSYQNTRGGRILLQDVKAPLVDWENANVALLDALNAEKKSVDNYYALKNLADKFKDADFGHRLDEYIKEAVDLVKAYGELVTQFKRCGPGLGLYTFDKMTMMKLSEDM